MQLAFVSYLSPVHDGNVGHVLLYLQQADLRCHHTLLKYSIVRFFDLYLMRDMCYAAGKLGLLEGLTLDYMKTLHQLNCLLGVVTLSPTKFRRPPLLAEGIFNEK